MEKQKTIKKEFSLSGIGLHSGNKSDLVFKPAYDNAGIQIIRVDLPQRPIIRVECSSVLTNSSFPRCTSLGRGDVVVNTVEHLMGVLCGLGIDNLTIEINGKEFPGLDGSGLNFLNTFKKVGIVEQNDSRRYFEIKEPLGISHKGSAIFVVPADEFKISYLLDYDHPMLSSQFFDITITPDTFEKEIASSRTFCLEREAEELLKKGFGKGANYQNTLVVGDDGVKENQLRFPNEFVRHKIHDLMGDLYLLGMPIKGHVFAVKSGHALNIELLKKINQQREKYHSKGFISEHNIDDQKGMDVHQIMKVLPHRYPFLLVDRIVELEKGKRAIGIKNVTINDGFFQGHFPARAVMPGVLMVEAMAQVGGIAILTNEYHYGKVAFFMGADNVKFRKVVTPGDQLFLEAEVMRDRTKTAQIRGRVKVLGKIVAEAEMMFSFTDAAYLNG